MLKLNLQYFAHLMQRADSLEKTLMLGKIEGKRTRGKQRIRCLDSISGHEFEQTPETEEDTGGWRAAVHGVSKSQTQLSN